MNLDTRIRKLEARANPPELEPITVTIRVYDDGPLPDPIYSNAVDGRPMTVRYAYAEGSHASD